MEKVRFTTRGVSDTGTSRFTGRFLMNTVFAIVCVCVATAVHAAAGNDFNGAASDGGSIPLSFQHSAASPWLLGSDSAHVYTEVANIGMNDNSYFYTSVNHDKDIALSFEWDAVCNPYDHFVFTVNGRSLLFSNASSPGIGYRRFSCVLPPGNYELKWNYAKSDMPDLSFGTRKTVRVKGIKVLKLLDRTVTDFVFDDEKVLLGYIGPGGNITIPSEARAIGGRVFWRDTTVVSAVIPEGVKEIAEYAFAESPSLKSVSIPASLEKLGEILFDKSDNLEKIDVYWDIPYNVKAINPFHGTTLGSVVLTVPFGTKSSYAANDKWRDFKEIIERNDASASFAEAVAGTGSENLTFQFSDDYRWYACNKFVTSGEVAVANGSSHFSTVVDHGKNIRVYFEWIVQCGEQNAFKFYIDDNPVLTRAGFLESNFLEPTYESFDYFLSPGRHTLKWEYLKGASADASSWDGARVRNLTVVYSDSIGGLSEFVVEDDILKAYNGTGGAIVVPDGVAQIAAGVLFRNITVTSVRIPATVTGIGESAFRNCESLKSVYIPSSIEDLGRWMFAGSTALEEITVRWKVPPANQIASLKLFDGVNTSAITLYVPAGTAESYKKADVWKGFRIVETNEAALSFAESVFDPVSVVVAITQSDDYPWVADEGFVMNGNKGLNGTASWFTANLQHDKDIEVSFDWYANSESFDPFLFGVNGRNMLQNSGTSETNYKTYSFTLPAGTHALKWEFVKDASGAQGFDGAKVRKLKVIYSDTINPDSDFIIENGVLRGYLGRGGDIVIPAGVTTIDEGVFDENASLVSVSIPLSVQNIYKYAFRNCGNLRTVNIPGDVKYIGTEAFAGVPLTNVNLPASLIELAAGAFGANADLVSIDVDAGNTKYSSENGVLYDKNKTRLIRYPAAKSDTAHTIPSSVTSIEPSAFEGAGNLKEITVLFSSVFPVTFRGFNPNNCILRVPDGKKAEYENIADWKNFKMILHVGEEVKDVLFEAELLDPTSAVPVFVHPSDYPWIPKTGYVTSGNAGMHGSVSRLSTEVEHNKSTEVYFEWYAGSELEADVFTFLTDGKKALLYSGTAMNDYAPFSYVFSPGKHSLSWEYAKDGSANTGIDGVRLRNLKISYLDTVVSSSDFIVNPDKVLVGYIGAGGDIVIPDGVEKIAAGVFARNSTVKSLVLSGSVKTIEREAFRYCDSLASVFIPASVEQIDALAFYGTELLREVRVERSVPLPLSDGFNRFTPYENKTLVVPNGSKAAYLDAPEWKMFANIVEEDENMFAKAVFDSGSVQVEFVHSGDYTWIADDGFVTNGNKRRNSSKSRFTALLEHDRDIEISFEYYVESESFDHFEFSVNDNNILRTSGTGMQDYESYSLFLPPGKHELTWEYIKDGVGSTGFDGAKVRNLKVTYSGTISPVSEFLIKDGVLLAYFGKGGNVYIPGNVTDIAESVFEGNKKIVFVYIPASVRKVNNYVFRNCDSLTSVNISDGIQYVGMEAFLGVPLTDLNIPASLTELLARAFGANSALTSINVDAGNTKYTSENGVLYDKNKTHLIQYPAAKSDTAYLIPATVGTIESYAFEGNTALREITVLWDEIVPVTFNGFNPGNCILRVPAGKKELYETAVGWKDFKMILYVGEDPGGASFETALLDSASVVPVFEHSSDYPWLSKTNYVASGNGRVPGSVSYFTAEVEHDKSIEVSFEWFVGSEAQRDVFSFRTDGKTALQSSGTEVQDFSSFSHVLAPGKHVLRWEYAKDEATDTGMDEARVRNLKITYLDTVASVSEFIINSENVLVGYLGAGGDIVIPDGVVKIATNVFTGNSAISSLVLSGSVTEIERNAFMNCDSLSYVYIPASVEQIGLTAFHGTVNLREVKVERTVPLLLNEGLNIFQPYIASLIVPRGTAEAYAKAPVWKNFPNIIAPDTIRVVFNPNGGVLTGIDTIFVVHDAILTPPSVPTHAKYAFKGWFKEPEGLSRWDFGTDKVTASMDLYARWGVSYDQELSFARGSSDSVEFNVRATAGKTFTVVCGGITQVYTGIGDDDVRVTGIGSSVRITAGEDCDFLRLDVSKQSLTSIDVSKSPLLLSLNCRNNNLQSLNVDSNTELLDLNCGKNNLTTVNVGNNVNLLYLNCYSNKLASIDVSRNTLLRRLDVYSNNISALDITNNTALKDLVCVGNKLTALDISKNTALVYLYCANNKIASLDVSKNPDLRKIVCNDNALTDLNTGENVALEVLCAGNNMLTSVDLSKNTALKKLSCSNNNITSLDLSANAVLEEIYCYNNNISLAGLYAISKRALAKASLGKQTLPESRVEARTAIPLDTVFNGRNTTVKVFDIADTILVDEDYYTLDKGILRFKTGGAYYVEVSNPAIISDTAYPAKVVASFIVSDSASSDATLKRIEVGGGVLSPAFSPDVMDYRLEVAATVNTFTVKGYPNHPRASVSAAAIELTIGDNNRIWPLKVTAENGKDTLTYTVTINRISSDANNNARLKSLTASQGNMSPAFKPDILEYTVKVSDKVDSIAIRGVAEHEGANVSNNGFVYLEYIAPGNKNVVTFTVTAEDRATTQTYTVIIDRVVEFELSVNGRNVEELGADVTELGPDETLISYAGDCDTASFMLNLVALDGNMKVTVGEKDSVRVGATLNKKIEFVPGKVTTVKIEVSANAGGGKHTYIFETATPIFGANLYYSRWDNVIAVNRNSMNNGGLHISEIRWRDKNNTVMEREYIRLTGAERPADYRAEIKTVETKVWHKVCSNVETKSYGKFTAYPNPVSRGESLILQLPESFVGGTLNIYSLSGQLIKSGIALTSETQAVSVADLTPDIYIFHVSNGTGEKQVVKIIVE